MTARLARLTFSVTLLLTAQSANAQSAERKAVVTRLDSLTRSWLASGPAAGVTVAVIRGRDTLLLQGVGERNRDKHLPATVGTVYRIGSVTKQFTAAAIMQLVEQHRIGLSDPITKYLPEYPQWRSVTVRQLLNHTSGIRSYTSNASWASSWSADLSPARIVGYVAKDTFDFAPGTKWLYNNTGYVLLGMILDRLTGDPYPDYMQSHFFKPMGLRSATYCPSRPTQPDHALGYALDGGAIQPARFLSMTHPYSAGALCMSVPDYVRWQTALRSGRVVSNASYRLMSAGDTLNDGSRIHYGFGLASGARGTHRVVGHNGSVNGFESEQLWFPDDSLQVVVFTNTTGAEPARLANNLAFAVLGMPLIAKPVTPRLRELAAGDRGKYVGVYDLKLPGDRTLPLHIFEEGGALISQAEGPGQGKIPLLYYGDDTFGAAFDPSVRITIFFQGGRATRARLLQGGGTLEGARRP